MSDTIQYKSLSPVSVKEQDHVQNHRSERISPLAFARPSKLNRSAADNLLLIATDLLMIFAWTGMFIYAILLWYARNRFVDEISFSVLNLIQAATTLSTLYSILFAASFARILRSLALWMLERGTKIGLLDQLIGSLSVSSALMTQISTGLDRNPSSHALGIGLIVLWLLSPLGSQSVLRIANLVPVDQISSATLLYMNSDNWSNLPPGGSDAIFYSNGADIVLNAALAAPINYKEQTRDVWGHVKIPKFSHMSAVEENDEGWRPVTVKSLDDYSSLFGLPIEQYRSSSQDATLNLTVESWYWDLVCRPWTDDSNAHSDMRRWFQFNATYSGTGYGPSLVVHYNLTGTYGESDPRVTRPMCISSPSNQSDADSAECGSLEARRFYAKLNTGAATYCDISTEHVETEITCAQGDCVPRRIRESRQAQPNRNWTIFDAQAGGSATDRAGASLTNQGSFWNNLARVLAGKPGSTADPLLGYIINPAQPFFGDGIRDLRSSPNGGVEAPNVLTIENALITSRFAQVVNSYYAASIGNILIAASQDTWPELLQKDQSLTLEYNDTFTNATSTSSVTVKTPKDQFQCSLLWLLIFTIITLLSLISAIIGLLFTVRIKGPRLAMNITTMLRDNNYSDFGPNASYMDDGDRSRKTRETKVRMMDVAASRDVGHIAICTVEEIYRSKASGLSKGRLYD